MARAQSHDDQIDKSLRAHRTHALIETQRDQPIDPHGSESDEFLAPTRQTRRSAVRIDEFLGTRLEHQHGGRRAQFRCAPLYGTDHLLMAEMHTIEIAHSQYAAPSSVGNVLQTAH
jgi:hypothetical protein